MSWCAQQARRRAVEHDAAVLHDVGVVGGVERDLRVLLDEQDRHAERPADGGQARHQLLDDDRRQPERQLVHEQQLRPAHERRADRQHLPLAAREQARLAAADAGQRREVLEDRRGHSPPVEPGDVAGHRRLEVLVDGQVLEHLAALGHQHDAEAGDVMRRPVLDAPALVEDAALGDARVVEAEEARDGPQRRGLAGAVGAEQRHDAAARTRQRHALHRGDHAVVRHLEPLDGEQRLGPASGVASRAHPRAGAAGTATAGNSSGRGARCPTSPCGS